MGFWVSRVRTESPVRVGGSVLGLFVAPFEWPVPRGVHASTVEPGRVGGNLASLGIDDGSSSLGGTGPRLSIRRESGRSRFSQVESPMGRRFRAGDQFEIATTSFRLGGVPPAIKAI